MGSVPRYVLVNMTQGSGDGFYVMPGEDPVAFTTLEEAAYELLSLMEYEGHTLETARIYKLMPLFPREIKKALDSVRREFEDDMEEVNE